MKVYYQLLYLENCRAPKITHGICLIIGKLDSTFCIKLPTVLFNEQTHLDWMITLYYTSIKIMTNFMCIFPSWKYNNEINGFPDCRVLIFFQIIFRTFFHDSIHTYNRDCFNRQKLLRESMKYFFFLSIAKLKDSPYIFQMTLGKWKMGARKE